MKIGIIFAMKEELQALRKYFKINKERKIYDLCFYEGIIHDIECVVVESGIGKVNAARTTQILIDHYKIDYLFNIGVAGGLSEKLNISDIIIGEKLVQHDFDITAFDHEKGYIPNTDIFIKSNKYLIDLAKTIKSDVNVLSGTIATGDIFCTDTKMSEKIHKQFNALCTEMESAAIAQVCYLCNIPFLILKSISDIPNNNNAITYEEFLTLSSENIAEFMNKFISKISKD